MKELIEHIKKHPAMTAIFALVGFLVFYVLLRGKSTTATNPAGQLAQLTLQEQQLQAGAGLQSAQLQAQVQANQGQQTLQQNTINASLSAQNEQTDAALIAALAQNQTQAKTATLSADVLNNQNSLEATVANNQTNAELQAVLGQYGVQTTAINAQQNVTNNQTAAGVTLAQLEAGLYGQELTAAQVLAQQQNNNSYNLSQSALGKLTDVGGSQNRVSIIDAALGLQAPAIAAEYGQTASSVSGDNLLASITNTIANFGKTTVNTLFG